MKKERELSIAIIELFEELLYKHDMEIPSNDREGNEDEARLYGGEYYELEDDITEMIDRYTLKLKGKRLKIENLQTKLSDIGEWIYNVSGVDENGTDKSGDKQKHILDMYKTLDKIGREIQRLKTIIEIYDSYIDQIEFTNEDIKSLEKLG